MNNDSYLDFNDDYTPTTADDPRSNYSGLDEHGWYPGKKRTVGQRIGQIASFGIYSPDNKFATDLNSERMILNNQAGARRQAGSAQHLQTMDDMAATMIKGGTPPEKAYADAANTFALQYYAKAAQDKAGIAQNELVQADAEGALPMAGQVGARRAEADLENEGARMWRARDSGNELRGRSGNAFQRGVSSGAADLGASDNLDATNQGRLRRTRTFNENHGPETMGEADLHNADASYNKSYDDLQAGNRVADISDATYNNKFRASIAAAAAEADRADAEARATGNPSTADQVARAAINRASAIPVGAGSTMTNLPYPTGTNTVRGQPPASMAEYDTILRDSEGKPIETKSRRLTHPGDVPTTADPTFPRTPSPVPGTQSISPEDAKQLFLKLGIKPTH